MRKLLTERRLWALIVVLSVLAAATVVALVLAISAKVHEVPQVARNAATQQAEVVAREQADRRADQLLHRVVLQICERQNSLRQTDNNAHYGDYVVFSFVAKRFLVPTKTETRAQKRVTNEFRRALRRAVHDTTWTPLVDCKRAVSKHGSSYPTPTPVLFSHRRPPAAALPAITHHH